MSLADACMVRLDLFREGSVIEIEYDFDINLLVAQVQGTRSRPYEVEIYFDGLVSPADDGSLYRARWW